MTPSTIETPSSSAPNGEAQRAFFSASFDHERRPHAALETPVDSNAEEDDDADLEELVEQSVRRFIGIGGSQSAHGNLCQLASDRWKGASNSLPCCEERKDEDGAEDPDSDEEFYSVHPTLLPFRKSKSTAFGGLKELKKPSNLAEMTDFRRPPIGRINPPLAAAFADDPNGVAVLSPRLSGIAVVWPEPDDFDARRRKAPAHPTVDLGRGDVLTVRTAGHSNRSNEGGEFAEAGDQSASCWSAPSQYDGDESESGANDLDREFEAKESRPSSSSFRGFKLRPFDSEESDDEEDELDDGPLAGEHLPRSWSAPPRILQFGGAEGLLEDDEDAVVMSNEYAADDDALVIRPLRAKGGRGMVRSFSSDDAFMKKRRRQHHLLWSSSCYALSVADENEEDAYVSSEFEQPEEEDQMESEEELEGDHERGSTSSVEEAMSIDAEEEADGRTRSVLDEEEDQPEFSDYDNADHHEDEEEEEDGEDEFMDALDPTLGEFSARRRSQFFIRAAARRPIATSKSDGQLRAAPTNFASLPFTLRPRTPLFGTSRNPHDETSGSNSPPNDEDDELTHLPPILLRHSATYHGRPSGCASMCGASRLPRSGLSFIDGLKLKQRLQEEAARLKVDAEKKAADPVELPTDLVESFAIEADENVEEVERKLDGVDASKWLQGDDEEVHPFPAETEDFPQEEQKVEEKKDRLSVLEDKQSLLLLLGSPDRAESLPGSWRPQEEAHDAFDDRREDVEMATADSTRPPAEICARLHDLERAADEEDEVMSARTGFSFEGSVGGEEVDFPLADDENQPPPNGVIPSRVAAPRALRRRSPPIASEDELSDSEISELERQLAQRHFGDEEEDERADETAEMPSRASQSPEVDIHYCRQPRDFYHFIPGSSSMPSFALRSSVRKSLGTTLEESERERLEETANWLRKSKTQQFNDENADGSKPTLEARGQLGGSRRRILPLRPDDVPMQRVFHPQQAIVQPLHVQEAAVHQIARRLPDLPLDSPAALVQPFGFPMSSNGLSTSAHSTAKSIPKANATPLRPNENVVHPLLRHTKPPPAGSLPPRGAIASQLGHEVDYQLSYGIEQSLVRSSTNYGLEDSYYEDGLNGNATHFDQRKVMNPYNNQEDSSGISSFASSDPSNSGPTHRAQFTFVPRHDDEVLLEIGDALKVEREYEDHWCFGTNLRTGQQGLFPAAHVCEIDLVEEITSSVLPGNVKPQHAERDTFYLTLLASIEVAHHKGNDVLVQAINKVCEMYQSKEEILVPQTVLMEVSFRGVHIIDKRKKDIFRCPTFDYFYSLQNLSFCGSHPKQLRYFGFITKHPLLPRFACHVFLSNESTQPIVESIGRAFKRSYDEYTAFIHPTEDIFIE